MVKKSHAHNVITDQVEMRRIGLVDQVKEDKEEMYGKDQMEDGMEEEM